IDGVRDLGEYNRDLFATESVEVLKGPSALLFGRGSTGGLINQTTKVADGLQRKELDLRFGSRPQQRLTTDFSGSTGDPSAARFVGFGEKSGNYRYPEDVEKIGVAPSFCHQFQTGTEVTVSYYYLKTSDITDYGQPTLSAAFTGTGQAAMPPIPADNY